MKKTFTKKIISWGLGTALLFTLSFNSFASIAKEINPVDTHVHNAISPRATYQVCWNCNKMTKAGVYRNKYNLGYCQYGGNHKEKLTRYTCGSCGSYQDWWIPDCGHGLCRGYEAW